MKKENSDNSNVDSINLLKNEFIHNKDDAKYNKSDITNIEKSNLSNSKKEVNHFAPGANVTFIESVLCGATAGVISRFFVAPLDVVKINLQLGILPTKHQNVTSEKLPKYKPNFINTVTHLVKNEGIFSLWKGNVPAELMYLAYGAVQFAAYSQINGILNREKKYLNSHSNLFSLNNNVISFISGSGAALLATAVTYPLDLLRTRFAAQNFKNKRYKSLLDSIRMIYLHEGFSGYYKGVNSALISVIPYMGLFFMCYGIIFQKLSSFSQRITLPNNNNENSDDKTDKSSTIKLLESFYLNYLPNDAIAGFLAGVIAKSLVFPLDTIRRNQQFQSPCFGRKNSTATYSNNIITCGKQILQLRGIRGLYRGLLVSLAKSAPASGITMWVFEKSLKILRGVQGYEKMN